MNCDVGYFCDCKPSGCLTPYCGHGAIPNRFKRRSGKAQRPFRLSGIGENRGAMIFQQGFFPPFSFVMLAAAAGHHAGTYTYVADQDATSSSFVAYQGQHYIVQGQPDSALLMPASRDPIAMLELKPESELNHQDLAKCIIWSSIAGQALVRVGVPQDQVRVPFLIGPGSFVSLFVTEFTDEGSDIFCPSVCCMYDRLSLMNTASRKKVLVALVLLLGRLKHQIRDLEGDALSHLLKRRKTKKDISRNIFSKRPKPAGQHQPPSTKQSKETGTTNNAAEHEAMSMDAVMKFCPDANNLTYPWPRYRNILCDDDTEFYQQSSPFFLRGQCLQAHVFYKIWRHGDEYVDEGLVEREVSLLRDALECGVATPSLLKYGRVLQSSHLFFVLQMSDCGDCHFVETRDELLPYSLSVIENVSRLHSKGRILHCDLKPENVLWNGSTITLLDFGHAQKVGEVSPVPGTSGYEAPEIAQGHPNTRLTDAFSVGKLLLAGIDRFPEKDKTLLAVAQRLCELDWQHRLSLDDASVELVDHQQNLTRATAKRAKTTYTNSRSAVCASSLQSIAA